MKPGFSKTVVVTRPAHQADALCNLISNAGGSVIRFPVLDIVAPLVPVNIEKLKSQIASSQIAIFISPNAVDFGMQATKSAGGLPESVKVAAVGQGSAKKLEQWGQTVDVFPQDRFDSESLLATSPMQSVDGQNILIFRGVGGRELLADTLRARGAKVDYVECYQRIRPDTDRRELSEKLAAESVDAAVVTSNEGLQNLYDMLSDKDRLVMRNVQLFVMSARTQALAHDLGFSKTAIVVEKAGDQAVMDSLMKWSKDDSK